MGALLFAMGVPTLVFGALALLAMRFGAESRPYFDEKPVYDDRPNWFPIAGSGSSDDDEDEDPPDDGEAVPVAEPAAPEPTVSRRRPAAPAPAAAS
jgi:hypothetical protein